MLAVLLAGLGATLRMSALLGAALVAGRLLRRTSASLRHGVLAGVLVCAAALPALQRVVPVWRVPIAVPSRVGGAPRIVMLERHGAVRGAHVPGLVPPLPMPPFGVARPEPVDLAGPSPVAAAAVAIAPLAVWLWAAGAVLSLLVLLAGRFRLAQLARQAAPASPRCEALAADLARTLGLRTRVRLLQSEHPTLLIAWGVRRPTVVVPRSADGWSETRLRVVLGHEVAHVRRHDACWLLVAALVRSIYWFNPLVWIAVRQLRHESEQCCDEMVLATGVDAPTYAAELLALAQMARACRDRWRAPLPAAAIFGGSRLESRIRVLLSGANRRRRVTRAARIVTSLVLAGATATVAGVRVSAEREPGPQLRLAIFRANRAGLLPDPGRPDGALTAMVDGGRRDGAGSAFPMPGLAPQPGGGLSLTDATLRELIRVAYDSTPEACRTAASCTQVIGGPPWLDTERFDVVLQVGGAPASEATAILERLLADRFHLAVHREGDTLVVDRADRPERP
jgi:beta-lactamase regulating signal transducer with metallopeptidase domain